MEDKGINIGSIINNVASTIIAAIVIGAGAIIWNQAIGLDTKIKKANENIVLQQNALKETQNILVKKIAELEVLSGENRELILKINEVCSMKNNQQNQKDDSIKKLLNNLNQLKLNEIDQKEKTLLKKLYPMNQP